MTKLTFTVEVTVDSGNEDACKDELLDVANEYAAGVTEAKVTETNREEVPEEDETSE